MEIAWIKEALKAGTHTELFPEVKNIKENAAHAVFKDEIASIQKTAEEELAKKPAFPLFSEYRMYDTTGDGAAYRTAYFNIRKRIDCFFMMYLLTEREEYRIALEDEIWVLCDLYTWASPTTMHGYSMHEKGFEERVPQQVYLDLWSTETAFALAEIEYILQDKLSAFIRHRIREEAQKRVLSYYITNDVPFGWESCDNNWAAVCGGSVGCAAIYLIWDSDLLAEYVARVLKTLEGFLRGFDEDGACVEGVSYWSYGVSYYLYFMELLKNRTGGKLDLVHTEQFHQIALFMQRCRIQDDLVINFADCARTAKFRIGFLHKLKALFSDVLIPPLAYSMHFHQDHTYRFAGFIRDFAWFQPAFVGNGEDVLTDGYYFKKSQIYTARKNGVFFGVVGGSNGRSHGHNDLGHFIYYVGNKGVFVDIGMGPYTKQYFSDCRYDIINNSAKGHSVPAINGHLQLAGEERYASEFGIDGDIISMDLTKAYTCKELECFNRAFQFFENGDLEVVDTFSLNHSCNILEQFLVDVTQPPRLSGGNTILLQKDHVSVQFCFADHFTFLGYEKIPGEVMARAQSQNMYMIKFETDGVSGKIDFHFFIRVVKK